MSFTDAGREFIEGAAAGLYEAGQIVMAQSQVLVPVDTGTLKRSGDVELPAFSEDSVEVTVGYGYGAAYAARVSAQFAEDPDAEHAYGYWVHQIVVRRDGHLVRHDPPTQALFLKVPAEAMKPELAGILEHAIQSRMGA